MLYWNLLSMRTDNWIPILSSEPREWGIKWKYLKIEAFEICGIEQWFVIRIKKIVGFDFVLKERLKLSRFIKVWK